MGATVDEEEQKYFLKNLVKADRLIFAKELKLQIIRNVFLNNSILYNIKQIESNLCQHCNVKDDNPHYFFQCKQVRHVWYILSEILNLNGNFVYIDLQTAIMGFTDLPTNDFRNLLVDFTRHEIKIAKRSGKLLTKNRLVARLSDLTLAMKTCGYQKKTWENLYYLLTFEKIENNFGPKKSRSVTIHRNQHLTNPSCTENISALPETLFNENPLFNNIENTQDLTNNNNLPKTFSYLTKASELLSEFIQASIKYGYLC